MIDVRGANVRAELDEAFARSEEDRATPAGNERRAESAGGAARSAEAKSVGGRPLILDATKRAEICALLAAGCAFRTAARYVGVTAGAISMLLKRDESFRLQVDKALADRELIPLAQVNAASGKSWRAAVWRLERTVKGTYHKDNGVDPKDIWSAVDEEHREFAERLIAARQAQTYLPAMGVKMEEADEAPREAGYEPRAT